MATHSTSGGASVPPTVVRLPTAAPRKVRQRWNKETRALRERLPRFTGKHIHWQIRSALRDARLLNEADRGAALVLAQAIYGVLTDEQRALVQIRLAVLADQPEAQQALAIARLHGSTIGRINDIRVAQRMLASGEVE